MKSDPDEDTVESDHTDLDEELDAAAQGASLDADEKDEDEVDAMGAAAGLPDDPEKPFRGIDKVDRRDQHRWELDPSSKDDETGLS